MRIPGFILLIILCFVIEAKVRLLGIGPAPTVLLVYYVGLRKGPVKGLLFGALLGMAADSFSGNILGPNLLSKGAVGFLSAFMTGGLFRWTPFLGLLGVSALTVVDGALSFTALALFAGTPTTISYAAAVMLGQAALNAVAGAFLRPAHED